jgi:hypothetical protein
MKSRRRMAFPKLGTTLYLAFELWPSKQKFATSDIGRNGEFACENPELTLGHSAMSAEMSVMTHFADSSRTSREVREVP